MSEVGQLLDRPSPHSNPLCGVGAAVPLQGRGGQCAGLTPGPVRVVHILRGRIFSVPAFIVIAEADCKAFVYKEKNKKQKKKTERKKKKKLN